MTAIQNADAPRRLIWRAMTALQAQYGYFTSPVLHDIFSDLHRKTVENYLAFLIAERVVEVSGTEARRNGQANQYRIINAGEAPPLRRNADTALGCRQQALWTAMRGLRQFRPQELALAASTEERAIPRDTASSYVRDLVAAGYIVQSGGSRSTYRLVPTHNTGPRAPIILRSERAVFDLNLMRTVNVTAAEIGRAA